jgi:cytochrome d ubiquinol oxidase subunit I
MQTPRGFHVADGRFFPDDWWAVIFNPSFPYRYAHNVAGFYITTGFVVLGVGAWLALRGRSVVPARLMMRMALNMLIVLVPLQMVLGDLHGSNTLRYQPAKFAAIEGRYDHASPLPLILFGLPDRATGTMHDVVQIPMLGSLLLTHSLDGTIRGLNSFPADERPPVAAPFYAFRLMVGIALVMLFVTVAGQVLRVRRRLDGARWFLRLCSWTAPLGFVAVIAGWTTTEVGRQPWTVYGLLRTAQSVTPSLTGTDVALSFALYGVVYLIMYPTGLAVMAGLVRRGVGDAALPAIAAGRPIPPFIVPAEE